MTLNGEPIQTIPPRGQIQVGIEYDDPIALVNLVPEYEEREAAIWSGHTWQEWRSLEVYERAGTIAHRRLNAYIRAHTEAAVERERERRQKLNAAKRGRRGR